MSNRKLSWTTALRDLKSDRAPRAAVRREILKTRAGGLPLCAWTGRSQRRYVFRVLPISAVDASDLRDMVVLGVDADGDIVGAFSSCAMPNVAAMQTAGATEIHLHSQCDTLFERAAVAADLRRLSAEAA